MTGKLIGLAVMIVAGSVLAAWTGTTDQSGAPTARVPPPDAVLGAPAASTPVSR